MKRIPIVQSPGPLLPNQQLLTEEAFGQSAEAIGMERRGHAVLRTLTTDTSNEGHVDVEFPLESDDKTIQRLLNRISVDLRWPEWGKARTEDLIS